MSSNLSMVGGRPLLKVMDIVPSTQEVMGSNIQVKALCGITRNKRDSPC